MNIDWSGLVITVVALVWLTTAGWLLADAFACLSRGQDEHTAQKWRRFETWRETLRRQQRQESEQ